MPFDLREIASIAGMPGLYRIVAPTRSGIIVESLAETPVRSVAQARNRVSILHEISMYTNDEESTVPLEEIFDRVRSQYGDTLPVTSKSSNPELAKFMETVLPDYDQDRVYASDMKKLVQWYSLVSKFVPYTEAKEEAPAKTEAKEETTEEAPAKEPKAKKAAAKK
ncbi:hypothetical protein TH61_02225 [Rufibacter sp. DG15C]|uniref:DUF5606 family protein n=1 Tax=Rufibacter sp. DG15C TaxID=1379909 RepID=UPI00078B53DE|nr:DUF5606 domain-containing protein [Rufibacter sp. DG15C]AMM50227.1 hypothetical protein TH61_02225 [Rufibacter sp. DG15C]